MPARRSLETNELKRLSAAEVADVKKLSEDLQLSENTCLRYYQAAPTASEVDPMFDNASDILGRAKLFFYYERRQVCVCVCVYHWRVSACR